MSAKVSGIVWEANLDRPLKYVLLALSDHAKHDGTDVFPSIAMVMYKTGYEKRQVQDLISQLVSVWGILELIEAGGHGPGSVNKYRIVLSKIPLLPEFEEWKVKRAKGAKIAPIAPDKGAVPPEKGCNSSEIRVHPSALEPNTPRTPILEPSPSVQAPQLWEAPAAKEKPKKKARVAKDDRTFLFQQVWLAAFKLANPDITPLWDPADAGTLGRFLKRNPTVQDVLWAKCVNNYFASRDTTPGATARERFLRRPLAYKDGPFNQYGRLSGARGSPQNAAPVKSAADKYREQLAEEERRHNGQTGN